jgi:transposase, IS5 family
LGASIIEKNIKEVSNAARTAIHPIIRQRAVMLDIEKGKPIRLDSIAVESDIHHPTDPTLLQDGAC